MLGVGCVPISEPAGFDEGDGDNGPVEILADGWETDFVEDGQICSGELCCRMGVVEVAHTQDELDALFDRLFDGVRRAPAADLTAHDLALVLSNQSCQGYERRYLDRGAQHVGPDLIWSVRFSIGDARLEGPGRSFIVAKTERLRYRSVLPDVDVTFTGGEAD